MRAKHCFGVCQQPNLVRISGVSKIHIYVVGSASVGSMAVVLLLSVHWLSVLSLFVGEGGVVIGPYLAMHY